MSVAAGTTGRARTTGLMRALAWRGLAFSATLIGAACLIQVLLAAAPGDPIDLLPNAAELRPVLAAEWGLDQPLGTRIWLGVARLLRGDLGVSLSVRPGVPVAELVGAAALRSMQLLVPALLGAMGAALLLAWWTAGRRSAVRQVVQLISVAPVFLLAYLSVMAFNEAAWHLMAAGRIARPGWFALPDQASLLRGALAATVLGLGSGSLAELHAACEDELVRLRSSDFVEAAVARGASTTPHLLWNLVGPLTHLASRRATFLVGGLVIVEKVLLLQGAGALFWDASLGRDYPLAAGLGLAAALVVCTVNLGGDALRLIIDPRARVQA